MKKLPDKLTLLNGDHKIIRGKFNNKFKECDELDGYISKKEKIIGIDSELDDIHTELVLWHELAHYFSDYYEVREDSEIFAEAFSKFVVNILNQLRDFDKDNSNQLSLFNNEINEGKNEKKEL